MATTKKATKKNTGLSVERSGSKFTCRWKLTMKATDAAAQKFRYRRHNGKKWSSWTEKAISKKATCCTFSLSASTTIKKIECQVNAQETGKSFSGWTTGKAAGVFTVDAPPTPSLSVSEDSANKTTFSWSINKSDTNAKWYYRCYYRTKCNKTPGSSTGWSAWTHAASSSYAYTDSGTNVTRTFQLKAVGPGGTSKIVQRYHYIGTAPVSSWNGSEPVSITKKSSYYAMTYSVNVKGSTYKVDSITPQYYIGTPLSTMAVPSDASWTDGTDYAYTSKKNTYALSITTSDLIGADECLWARVKTTHDGIESYSKAYRVLTGALTAPTCSISMGTPSSSGFSVTVTISDAGTEVPGAYAEVYLEKASATGIENHVYLGSIANGSSSATLTSTEDLTSETGYSIHVRNVTADGHSMVSDYYTYSTSMPSAPTLDSVSATTVAGKVHVAWTNNWSSATGTVIAWTDDPDNWMSNDEPETYEVTEKAAAWYITGLETGKTWYFKIRSFNESDDSTTYSPWSDEYEIDLSSAPAIPMLYLSDEVITEDGMVTAYWSYVSTDGTAQVSGVVVEMEYDDTEDEWTVGGTVGATTAAQHIDIYAKEQGWENGDVVYLALRTRSGSGGESDYSTPVQLAIAAAPTVSITATSFETSESVTETLVGDGSTRTFTTAHTMSASPTVTVDGTAATVSSYTDDTFTLSTAPDEDEEIVVAYTTTDNYILDKMSLTATVTATNSATLTTAIERAVAYPMERPDGTMTDGALGETIYVNTIAAESANSISIAAADLIGHLDDGAYYNLVVTVADVYGQEASSTVLFKVHWYHQAWNPTATFVTDSTNYITRITPVAGTDYVSGDTCDIYRLSADQPELVYSGAAFGTEYVDPYPAFGELSGYKVVTVTEYGDYITEDDEIADYDTTDDDDTTYAQLDPGTLVIDFNGKRVELPYNITLSNSWAKDFQRTAYLGGHVTGDHNRAVTRDLTSGTVIVKNGDAETMALVRSLARYAGLCHVRTPEGSSFTADVQVSEAQGFGSGTVDYSLTIQKVDTVGFDGMTYADWSEMQS